MIFTTSCVSLDRLLNIFKALAFSSINEKYNNFLRLIFCEDKQSNKM